MLHQEDLRWMPELVEDTYWHSPTILGHYPKLWFRTHLALSVLYTNLLPFDPVIENAVRRGHAPCRSCYGADRVAQIEARLAERSGSDG